MLSKSPVRRNLIRVAVAGALVTVPLGALAVTASAAAPDSAQTVSAGIPLENADIAERPHGGPGERPGPGPRAEFHDPGNHHQGDGPMIFKHVLPPTGSAGSS